MFRPMSKSNGQAHEPGALKLHNWFEGQTRCPHYTTIAAVSASLGYSTKPVKTNEMNFEHEIAKAAEEIAQVKERLEKRRAKGATA